MKVAHCYEIENVNEKNTENHVTIRGLVVLGNGALRYPPHQFHTQPATAPRNQYISFVYQTNDPTQKKTMMLIIQTFNKIKENLC